jgi:hypothetical protein
VYWPCRHGGWYFGMLGDEVHVGTQIDGRRLDCTVYLVCSRCR